MGSAGSLGSVESVETVAAAGIQSGAEGRGIQAELGQWEKCSAGWCGFEMKLIITIVVTPAGAVVSANCAPLLLFIVSHRYV